MRYQVVELGAGEIARVGSLPYIVGHPDLGVFDSTEQRARGFVPEMELVSNTTILLKRLVESDDSMAVVQEAQQEMQNVLADTIRAKVAYLIEESPDDYEAMTIFVRTQPTCLCADEPSHPIYDQDSVLDEDTDEWVYPEDAVVIGHTENKVGWVFYTVIGLALTPKFTRKLPVHEGLPLVVRPVGKLPDEHRKTARGRSNAATAFGQSVSFLVGGEG